MISRFAGRSRGKPPDRGRIIFARTLRLVALDPPEEAGLVLPHIPGARQDGAILRKYDLMMNKGAMLLPYLFEQRLVAAGVPAIPGRILPDRLFERHPNEGIVKSLAELGTVDVRVFFVPVLVLPPLNFLGVVPLVRMVGSVIGHKIRRVGFKQDRALFPHEPV